jgi:hypothetical protein
LPKHLKTPQRLKFRKSETLRRALSQTLFLAQRASPRTSKNISIYTWNIYKCFVSILCAANQGLHTPRFVSSAIFFRRPAMGSSGDASEATDAPAR